MNSSRWSVATGILATGIVVAGVGFGAVAYMASEGVSAQGAPMGPALSFVPDGANLIGYVDLKSVASSPLAEGWSQGLREQTPLAALDEIEEETGIDLLDDVDSLTFAVGPEAQKTERWGVAVTGSFDRELIVAKLRAHEKNVEIESHAGADLYVIRNGSRPTAVAQPDGSTLLVGDPAYVREMLDTASGTNPSAAEKLASWGYGGFEDEAFWFAGAPPDFVREIVGRGSESASLRSFALTGRLDTDLLLRARGRAKDAKTAEELADVVRGLVALGRLRQDASPEGAALSEMMESISVELANESIDVSLAVPYDSIRRLLSSRPKAAAQP